MGLLMRIKMVFFIVLFSSIGPAIAFSHVPVDAGSSLMPGVRGQEAEYLDLSSYSQQPEIKEFVRTLLSRAKNKKPRGACYKYTKLALAKSGIVNHYLKGQSAKNAGKELERACFTNIIHLAPTPEQAPVGAILLYKGGPHGHVEVRTPSGFASDYFSHRPRTGSGARGRERVLTAVYVRLGSKGASCALPISMRVSQL